MEAHRNGTMVAVFNTHSKDRNMEAIEKNVDFIQSDKVKHLIKILK
jgi:glycerophosphoryl diester phosphodiesterase